MRVLLSGYYGFGNLGDEAILAGLGAALTARGHVPVALSGDPAATQRLHSLEARHRTKGLFGAIASVDAVVSGGGGLLQDATSKRSLAYYLLVLRLARLAGRRIAVYGQSLGPLGDSGRAKLARQLRTVPLFVRDRPSLGLAAGLGLDARLVSDAALLLAQQQVSAPKPTESVTGPVVLVPRGGHEQYNLVLERLAEALAAAGTPLAVLALHPQEDLPPATRLRRAVRSAQWLGAATPHEAIARLRGASYVVSARLHGSILAAVAGVGFAGLSYDPKVAGFLEQAGAPAFEAPVDEQQLYHVVTERVPADVGAVAGLVRTANSGVDDLLAALWPRA